MAVQKTSLYMTLNDLEGGIKHDENVLFSVLSAIYELLNPVYHICC